ncbi:MAG: PEP-CTERM motif-containing protein [Verrucomicrobia bacterium]|nr:MAG: PEP-CTERM motif-containing protein [Verrucomicrobiota bacterium]
MAHATTVITFDGFSSNNADIAAIAGFGDNIVANSPSFSVSQGLLVSGTPGISLDWLTAGWDTYTGWNGRGSVAQIDFNGIPTISILFTPTPDSAVVVKAFDLDEWAGGGAGSINWNVSGSSSGILASGNWTKTNAGGRDTIALPASSAGLLGEPVTLSFTLLSGASSYFALDNLTFDQVPEPSSAMLAGLGLGAAIMRRRRHSA